MVTKGEQLVQQNLAMNQNQTIPDVFGKIDSGSFFKGEIPKQKISLVLPRTIINHHWPVVSSFSLEPIQRIVLLHDSTCKCFGLSNIAAAEDSRHQICWTKKLDEQCICVLCVQMFGISPWYSLTNMTFYQSKLQNVLTSLLRGFSENTGNRARTTLKLMSVTCINGFAYCHHIYPAGHRYFLFPTLLWVNLTWKL